MQIKPNYFNMKLRQYQTELSERGADVLAELGIVYFAMEVRTGKTLTALNTAELFGAKNVLFLTKKKAIGSIESDFEKFGFSFDLTVINDESMHKLTDEFDLVIHDEHHRFGSFPKPGKATKLFKQKYSMLPMIFLSGTPHPESYSQIYHQFWVSLYSPFNEVSFYKWSHNFVNIKVKELGFGKVNDYTDANKELIDSYVDKYFIRFTQKDAGFETNVIENVLKVEMKPSTYAMCKRLKNDLVIEGSDEVILADTPVKLMQKLHQMYSGTVKFESGNRMVLDTSKIDFIKERFKSNKIGIFYKFKAEWDMIKEAFGSDVCQDVEEFNSTDKNIALQIVSGREGINLSSADYLVYINIDFSAVSYFQSRDRLTTMDRKSNEIFYVFSNRGIEEKIYKSVLKKKDFTLSVFKKEFVL
tara:strand:- start:800 stop:2044 length:1245 start_codon:yes stop_codon:yes gene_type:complete